MKRLFRLTLFRPLRRVIGAVIAAYIRFVGWSLRWERIGLQAPVARFHRREPIILCFWHSRLLLVSHVYPAGPRVGVMVSHHRDGQLIAHAVANLGYAIIAGSTSQGGEVAAVEACRWLERGGAVAITPDGPRGPRMRASPGVIRIAQRARAPIYPLSVASSRRRVLNSWDRFILALPFGRGLFLVGEPIWIPAEANGPERERLRLLLEERLIALDAEADRRLGHAPVEAALPRAKPAQ